MRKIQFTVLLISRVFSRYLNRLRLTLTSKKNNDPYRHFHFNKPKKKTASWYKYGAVLGILIFILLLVLGVSPYIRADNNLSEGFVGVYTTSNLPQNVTELLSRPLVRLDKTSSPQPDLAENWTIDSEAKTYTFKLKDNLSWNDETPVRSSDIKFDLSDVSVEYPDNRTIVFRLSESYSPFPTLLTSPVFKQNGLLGIGSYKVSSLEMNGNFIKKMQLDPVSGSTLPKLTIRFYPDEKTAQTAFDLGEVDSLINVSEIELFQSYPSVGIRQITNYNKLIAIFYNLDDPVLSDAKLRLALTAATPITPNEERAKTSIQPHSWAFNPDVKDILGDLDKAKEYFSQSQGPKDQNITLTTTSNLSSLGETVIDGWKKIGVKSDLKIESGVPQNFQALLISDSIPSDPDQYSLWHSTQSKTNISKATFAPRIDKSLEDGRKVSDLNQRKTSYLDFQKVIADNAVATFLYFPKINVVYRQKSVANLNIILPLQVNILD